MPTAYVGPGWENPERKKMEIGGSLADFYIRDGFTVASIVEAGEIDKKKVESGCDIAIFLPNDAHRTSPHKWVRDLYSAEQFIEQYRASHPDLPTEPVPLAVHIPDFTTVEEARPAVLQIAAHLREMNLDLYAYGAVQVAKWLFLYGGRRLQNRYINQDAVDHAYMMAEAELALADLIDEE